MKRAKLFLVCVFLFLALAFFWYTVEKDESISSKNVVNSNTTPAANSQNYYMKLSDNWIVIYNKDHTVYEFTDIQQDFLPASLINELTKGKYFKDQKELYEFLETYTS